MRITYISKSELKDAFGVIIHKNGWFVTVYIGFHGKPIMVYSAFPEGHPWYWAGGHLSQKAHYGEIIGFLDLTEDEWKQFRSEILSKTGIDVGPYIKCYPNTPRPPEYLPYILTINFIASRNLLFVSLKNNRTKNHIGIAYLGPSRTPDAISLAERFKELTQGNTSILTQDILNTLNVYYRRYFNQDLPLTEMESIEHPEGNIEEQVKSDLSDFADRISEIKTFMVSASSHSNHALYHLNSTSAWKQIIDHAKRIWGYNLPFRPYSGASVKGKGNTLSNGRYEYSINNCRAILVQDQPGNARLYLHRSNRNDMLGIFINMYHIGSFVRIKLKPKIVEEPEEPYIPEPVVPVAPEPVIPEPVTPKPVIEEPEKKKGESSILILALGLILAWFIFKGG